ncbi:hypothetical protein Pint_17269 [Pistacia integerrima]|uniref:Uncharacterized protein n=1 Tax=Pistacia integerrima TaxID=434235 RepID=A0ACC0YY44_9ROSI|nr:hypothetical protein Pint_17269 [Pistacia integerrima]
MNNYVLFGVGPSRRNFINVSNNSSRSGFTVTRQCGGGVGGMNCQDCGNQAKKDCSYEMQNLLRERQQQLSASQRQHQQQQQQQNNQREEQLQFRGETPKRQRENQGDTPSLACTSTTTLLPITTTGKV